MADLLASAGTLDEIRRSITDFYAGTLTTLAPDGADAWKIKRASDGKELEGVRVTRKRGRFRFEMF